MPSPMPRVLTDSLTHAFFPCMKIISKQIGFCFSSREGSLDGLRQNVGPPSDIFHLDRLRWYCGQPSDIFIWTDSDSIVDNPTIHFIWTDSNSIVDNPPIYFIWTNSDSIVDNPSIYIFFSFGHTSIIVWTTLQYSFFDRLR